MHSRHKGFEGQVSEVKTSMIKIRTASIADCQGIQSVHAGTPGPWANINECIPWISKRIERGYYVQVAELNGEIVGHAEWVETADPSGKFFYLCVMQIKPNYQGHGIGRKMVEDGIAQGKIRNCTKLVTIPELETGSEKFYFKCGFTKGREIKSISIPTKDYGYSQNYTEAASVPFEVIGKYDFILGLDQASSRHIWEVCNAKPDNDERKPHTLISPKGDFLQIDSYAPPRAWAICWSNKPTSALVKDILTLGKSKNFEKIAFEFFEENKQLFREFDIEIEDYCYELNLLCK